MIWTINVGPNVGPNGSSVIGNKKTKLKFDPSPPVLARCRGGAEVSRVFDVKMTHKMWTSSVHVEKKPGPPGQRNDCFNDCTTWKPF